MTIDAPDRSVCALTGEIADGLSFPAQSSAVIIPALTRANMDLLAERDEARQQRDDAKAELDNVTHDLKRLGQVIADMTANVRAWHQDRDDAIESRDEWRDRYDAACEVRDALYARVDELQAEIRGLRGEQ